MWPILTDISGYEIGSFGVLVAIALLVGLAVARHLGKDDGLDPRKVNDIGLAVLFVGILGSKLLGVIVALISGAQLDWSELRNAGAVHGGLAAAVVCAYLMARKFKLPLMLLFDAYVPAGAIGQAIGRLGCLAAGCCFGSHSDAPWAITFTNQRAFELGGVPLHISLHPVQLYDAGLHLLLFALLFYFHKKQILRTKLFGLWCILEGMTRFFVESYRGDLGRGIWFGIEGLSTGRITALSFALLGCCVLLLQRHQNFPKQGQPSSS